MNFLASVMSAVLGAITVAVTLPMIDAYGAAVMYLLCALLIWISYGYVVVPTERRMDSLIMISDSGLYYLIKYGDEMRAGIDIVSSAVENNSKLLDCT
jgi:hypothetical protein